MARLIDGKLISKQIKDELKEEAAQLKDQKRLNWKKIFPSRNY